MRGARFPVKRGLVFSVLLALGVLCGEFWPAPRPDLLLPAAEPVKKLDPVAWGGDHVGRPLPEFVTGGECLFCHRVDVGPAWQTNRHNLTVRDAEPGSPEVAALWASSSHRALVEEVKLVLGGKNRVRYLKPTAAYGQAAVLSTQWVPPRDGQSGRLIDTRSPRWDEKQFGASCAGCHASGVESKTRTFSTLSLDCYVCHGEVTLEHTKDTALAWLSKKRNDPPRAVTSICAQCHVRTGHSRSSGLPYPNHFVAGDNLFRDFAVDFSDRAIARLNPADRHVLENVRDVVVYGKEDVTCLSCHTVHKPSGKKHHKVGNTAYCTSCHNPTGPKSVREPYEVHSRTCEY